MPKIYHPPHLVALSALSEGKQRLLLTSLLLTPRPIELADKWLYAHARDALFMTEYTAATRNLYYRQQGFVKLQYYYTDLHALVSDVLFASKQYLKRSCLDIALHISGGITKAAVCPRYLLLSILQLLRSVLSTGNTPLVVVNTSQFYFSIQGAHGAIDLTLPRAVAALHGGRLLTCKDNITFQFSPQTEKTAYPRWHSPGTDGFLRDPLSLVQTAFSYLTYSASSANNST